MVAVILFYWIFWVRRNSVLTGIVITLLIFFCFAPGYATQYLLWILPFVIILPQTYALVRKVFLWLFSVEIFAEYAFRPYTGHLFEWVYKYEKSNLFTMHYGQERDITITLLLRLPLWLFCFYSLWYLSSHHEEIKRGLKR